MLAGLQVGLRRVPLGYGVEARRLVVVEEEAHLVQGIFERFATLGSALEVAVLAQLQRLPTTPEMIGRVLTAAKTESEFPLPEPEVTGLLADFGQLWPEPFPAEQARLLQLLVEPVDVLEDGLASLVAELRPHKRRHAA